MSHMFLIFLDRLKVMSVYSQNTVQSVQLKIIYLVTA